MTEEIQTQNEPKNTVALVGMICSIIWLILLFTIIGSVFWFFLLFLWLILGIIGLFYKPRGKARVAVCIPLIVFISIFSIFAYIWSSIKTPAMQFVDRVKVEFENIDEETFDDERFNEIVNEEFNNIFSSINEEDFKALLEASTWSNILEKWSYVFFWMLQEGMESSLEKYNNGYIPEISDENNVLDIDIDVNNNEEDNKKDEIIEEIEIEEPKAENKETFSQSERNDIEEILNILE